MADQLGRPTAWPPRPTSAPRHPSEQSERVLECSGLSPPAALHVQPCSRGLLRGQRAGAVPLQESLRLFTAPEQRTHCSIVLGKAFPTKREQGWQGLTWVGFAGFAGVWTAPKQNCPDFYSL